MRKLISLSCLAVLLLSAVSFSQDKAGSAPFSVDSLVFATGVEARMPVGAGSEFAADVGKVSCWVKVSASQEPISMKHVWSKDGKIVFELPLSLTTQSGRIWSTKSVTPGSWKVDIVDNAGNVIKSGSFTVK
jgi:hypothetical protein